MKRLLSLSVFVCLSILMSAQSAVAGRGGEVRDTLSLNEGWDFWYDHSPRQVSQVNLPHDFQISQPWVAPQAGEQGNRDQAANSRSRLSARGFKEMNVGWYRKVLRPDPAWKGRRILLDFQGIMLTGDVYLNGERIGGTDYGYLGFEIDITRQLLYDGDNVLLVRADTQQPDNSRWYTGGGLYRDVNLVITPSDGYFVRHPLYIRTLIEPRRAAVLIDAELSYGSRTARTADFLTRIYGPDGRLVAEQRSRPARYRSQRVRAYRLDTVWVEQPRLWSCEQPHLYTAEVSFFDEQGELCDRTVESFGIRSISYSPQTGFSLNGRKLLLQGCANHHTMGPLGAADYPRAIEYQLKLLKSFGYNHVRTSHNPYSEAFLKACDRLGILVVDELYDKWLKQYAGGRAEWTAQWQNDVPEFVRRDRNHPSVVMWSLGNELQQYANLPFNDWGVTAYRLQRELLHRYDDSRPVTVAMHPRYRSLETDSLPCDLALATDIASYNYRYMYFPGDGRRFPHMIFYQSEANTVGIPANFFEMDRDRVVGLAYWGALDYIGESGGWPAKGWAQGAFDLSWQPKPIAWLVKSMFSDEPTVRLAVLEHPGSDNVWNGVQIGTELISENWNRPAGDTVSLYTYTNADQVELLLNGRSLGVRQNTLRPAQRNKIRWDKVPYAAGRLEAVARKDGRIVARHSLETSGPAVTLKLETSTPVWKADGRDLQIVRLTAVDRQGRKVWTAGNELQFSLNGPAQVLATCSGNISSEEIYTEPHVRLFQGTAVVVLRSQKQPGKVVLKVTASGLKEKILPLKTE
ncbi:MAG: DUF4982 domain-containing protein [Bacteroidales bacterium]|nr:DUF4982 domain-containing protein [Bacteroidales bacterium]